MQITGELANFGLLDHTLCGTPVPNYLPWYCIKSEPSREQRAQRSLDLAGIETFLPELPRRKSIPFLRPLFPSYLFARFSPNHHMHTVKTSPGVSYVLGIAGEPSIVDDGIISAIQTGLELEYYAEYKSGDQVVITDGPFSDLRGVFQREISGTERVIILLNSLNMHGRIELDKRDVAAIRL